MTKIDVFGVDFNNTTIDEAVSTAMQLISEHRAAYMVTPNPEIVMETWKNDSLKAAVNGADMVLPDGIGVVKAAKLLGTPLTDRVPGIDTASAIMAALAEKGGSAFLFGSKPGVAEAAAEYLEKTYRGLSIVGCRDGYFNDDTEIIDAINEAKPDFLFVCLGFPKQELWMQRNAGRLNVGLMAGLGGSLDVFAGTVLRAPKKWQELGLEWLYRVLKEPKRIKRIARLPLFLVKAAGLRLKRLLHG